MPITDYMFSDDPERGIALWLEKRAVRAGYGMDRTMMFGPSEYRLYDAETGWEVIRSASLKGIRDFLDT